MPNKLFRTTTFRLSLTYLVLFAASAAIAIGYIYWNTTVLFSRQVEQTIEAEIRGLAEQYRDGGINRLAGTIARRSRSPGNNIYLVTDSEARHIAGNVRSVAKSLWNTVGRVEFAYGRQGQDTSQDRLAVASVFRLSGGYRLIVGRDIEDRRVFERVIRSAFVWGIGCMALVGLIGGWLVSRRLMSRLDAMAETSRTIMAGDLSGRVPVNGSGDELDRLSESLNAMLARIEQLMGGLREVSDNIAHDLKTPLNRLRNRVEDSLRGDGGEVVYREALEQTIEEADELIKTFNALLSIARLEAGAAGQSMEEVDVSVVLRDVAELYEPVAEEQGMSVRLDLAQAPDISIQADRQLLGQALANLIENALKYADSPAAEDNGVAADPERSMITLRASAKIGAVILSVADHGPGIPAHERERVLKRFVRLEASRSAPGSGLGLSLVAAVARLHGGTLHLEDNSPGLRAVLSLPIGTAERTDAQNA